MCSTRLDLPTMTAIFVVCSAAAARPVPATTRAIPRRFASAGTASEEQRQRREKAALKVPERAVRELVVGLEDQERAWAPEKTDQLCIETQSRLAGESLVAQDAVEVPDERERVLDVEAPFQLPPCPGLEREFAGEEVVERGDFKVGTGVPVPLTAGMGIDASAVEADLHEGRSEYVADRDSPAADTAVLLLLAAMKCEFFLCGPICCGIEAPALPGRLVQELQPRRVLREESLGDERPLDRPREWRPPDEVPETEGSEKLPGADRQCRGCSPIEVETFDREHTVPPSDAFRWGEADKFVELHLREEGQAREGLPAQEEAEFVELDARVGVLRHG